MKEEYLLFTDYSEAAALPFDICLIYCIAVRQDTVK